MEECLIGGPRQIAEGTLQLKAKSSEGNRDSRGGELREERGQDKEE